MCGIAGYVRFAGDLEPQALQDIALRMARAQAHRGPDDEGVWLSKDGRCALAHRRLSVIDTTSGGHQPMESHSGRYCISFNGEIYNYQEVRRTLEARGRTFRSQSDTEVLLAALEAYDSEAYEHLDGMYGFGRYDNETGELLLARDPFGEKPVYTFRDADGFAFASELQGLREVPGFDPSVSLDAVAELLCFQYVDAPRAFHRGVEKLEPGTWMRLDRKGRPRSRRHFHFSPGNHTDDGRSIDDYADELEALLVESLRRRLIADVPLGAFLSGGIDSSTIVALIAKKLGRPIQTYSIGFEGSEESEHELAAAIATHLGSVHRERVLPPSEVQRFQELGGWLDEPNADTSCLPTYLLSEFTREEVTVAVSGDGGDELFGGYGRYLATLADGPALEAAGGSLAGVYGDRILLCSQESVRELLGFMPRRAAAALTAYRGELDADDTSPLARMRASDVRHYMPGAVLAKVDRMSMQHALEVRTPFLTRDVARFAESLPERALVEGDVSKVVLRRLASRYLPAEIVGLPKKGFGLPMAPAWAGEGFGKQLEAMADRDGPLTRCLGKDRLDQFRRQQERGAGTTVYRMAAMVVLDSYLRNWKAELPSLEEGIGLDEIANPHKESPSSLALLQELRSNGSGLVVFCHRSVPTWIDGLPDGTRVVTPLPLAGTAKRPVIRWDWEDAGQPVPAELDGPSANLERILLYDRDASSLLGPGLMHLIDRPGGPPLICRDGATWVVYEMTPSLRRTRKLLRASDSVRRRLVDGGLKGLSRVRRSTKLRFALPLLDRSPIIPLDRDSIRHNQGFAYQVRFTRSQTDRDRDLSDSYVLYEDGRPLPSPGIDKREIRQLGGGRYCLVNENAFFSTADGSDPRKNGRSYFLMRRSQGRLARLQWLLRDLALTDLACTDRYGAAPLPENELRDRLRARMAADDVPVRLPLGTERDTPRLAMVTASLGPGGAERQLANLALRFSDRGLQVRVVAIEALVGPRAHYLPTLRGADIPVTSALSPSDPADLHRLAEAVDPEIQRILMSFPAPLRDPIWGLFLEIWSLRPDAVYCQLDSGNILGGVAAWLAGVPRILLSARNVNPTHFPHMNRPWFKTYYEMLMTSKRVQLSGNSQVGNDDYAGWLGIEAERFCLIRNGLMLDELDAAARGDRNEIRRELGIGPDEPFVLGVFRLSPEKRPELFLDVVERMATALPNLQAAHAGQGPLSDEIAGAVQARPLLRGRLRLLGRRTDAQRLIRAADLLILTSHQEGTPNVVLEAQYLGTPVVCCDAGGAGEAVADGRSGQVCSTSDPDRLARAALTWIQPERREEAAHEGRRFVLDAYSLEGSEEATLKALGLD